MKDPSGKDGKDGKDKKSGEKEKVGDNEEGGDELDDSKIIVDLCAADHNEMEQWMNAIKDFHNCDIVEGPEQKVINILKPPSITQDEIIESERAAKDEEDIV